MVPLALPRSCYEDLASANRCFSFASCIASELFEQPASTHAQPAPFIESLRGGVSQASFKVATAGDALDGSAVRRSALDQNRYA